MAGLVFLSAAFGHYAFTQSENQRRAREELRLVWRQTWEIAEELLNTQTQALQTRQALEQVGRAVEQRVSQMVNEVKVLQNLIESFSKKQAEVAMMNGQMQVAERPRLVLVEGGKAISAPSGADLRSAEDQEVLGIVQEALRLDRVDVYLQPIVSLPQRKNRYYECFTRIRSENGTVIGPGQYIGVAEREGLVSSIDNMLLFRCIRAGRYRIRTANHDRQSGPSGRSRFPLFAGSGYPSQPEPAGPLGQEFPFRESRCTFLPRRSGHYGHRDRWRRHQEMARSRWSRLDCREDRERKAAG